MRTVHLINPNTSTATTAMMLARAREAAPPSLFLEGLTAKFGPPMITEPAALAAAADAVVQLMPRLTGDGVIVAAFGDPGANWLASRLSVPVVGIGEAAIRAAGRGGRRFAIVTTTPRLASSIRAGTGTLGFADGLANIRITTEDPAALVADPPRLEAALRALVRQCVEQDGAEAIIIGGGPLADAARALAAGSAVEIIEPVAAAVAAMAHVLNVSP
jgi:Asp/Glu/hydantoin racemase